MKKIITSILFIFSIIFLYAQINPIIFKDFGGGLNTKTSTNKLPINESPDLLNCDLDEIGGIKMRYGMTLEYTLPVSTSVKILSNFVATYNDGTQEFIVQAGSVIFCGYGDNNWKIIKTGSDNNSCSYTMFNDELWITNGIDDVGIWDRTTYKSYPFIPKGKYIISDKEQIIIAGVYSDPSSIFYSSLFDTNGNFATAKNEIDWKASNTQKCGSGDGQIITGLFKMYDRVYVVKQNSIYSLLTQDNYDNCQIIRYTSIYGCANNQSIADYKNTKIMLNQKGLIKYNGDIDVEVLTQNIDDIIKHIGVLSTEEKTLTVTTQVDFSTGVYENCYNNYGTIEISTQSKKWGLNVGGGNDFVPMGVGSSQVMISYEAIKISTYLESGRISIDLKPYSISPLYRWYPGDLNTHTLDNMVKPSGNTAFLLFGDARKGTFDATKTTIELRFNDLYSPVEYQIEGIEIQFRTTIWFDGCWSGGCYNQDIPLDFIPRYSVPLKSKSSGAFYNFTTYPFVMWAITSDKNYEYEKTYTIPTSMIYNHTGSLRVPYDYSYKSYLIDIKNEYPDIFNAIKYGTPSILRLVFQSGVSTVTTDKKYWRQKRLDGQVGTQASTYGYSAYKNPTVYSAIHIPLVTVYTSTFTTPPNTHYKSGTYISPIFDTGSSSISYKNLYSMPFLGVGNSTGTVVLYTRTDDNSDMSSPTDWYSINSSSETDDNIDLKKYFQWKAELVTSTVTFSPEIYETELEYCIAGATYTSKVFNLGVISDWGSFIPAGSNDIEYSIRAATYSFDIQDTNIGWTSITSGEAISLDTGKNYVQWRGYLPKKNSYIESVTITSYVNTKGVSSGRQSTPSAYYKGRYYIGYSSYTNYNTDVLIYDRNGAFTRYDWKAAGFAEFRNNFYILSSTIPYIYKLSETLYTDNGLPINFYWKSPDYDFGETDYIKDLWHIYMTGLKKDNSFAYIDTYTNIDNTKTSTRYWNLGENYNYKIQGSSQTYGKNISIVIRSTSTVGCEIHNFNLYLTKRQLQ